MFEKKERKYIAPEGYLYHKDGRYAEVIYPLPSQSIAEYDLVTVAEYEEIMKAQEGVNEENG